MKLHIGLLSVLLFKLIIVINGVPYANNYPYKAYEYSENSAGDTEGGEDISGFLKNHRSDKANDLKSALDSAKFYNTENLSKLHDLNHVKQGGSTDSQKHSIGENFETDKSHNRKQVKSGFHNSYHKDESGSNSSFYEDSDDRGGKLVFNKLQKFGGDNQDSKYHEGLRDGIAREKLDDRFGGYDARGTHDREHLLAENQGNRHGYRDGYVRGQGERVESFDDNRGRTPNRYITEQYGTYRPLDDGRQDDRFYRAPSANYRSVLNDYSRNMASSRLPILSSPPLTQTLNKPLQDDGYFSRHRITIYEDPREFIDPRGEFNREDSIYRSSRLDVRPSPLRFRGRDDENRRYRF